MSDNSECPHKGSCALFPLFRLRSSLSYWMDSYCKSDYTRCQRYQSMCEGRPPPATMLPSGKHVHELGSSAS